MYVHFSCIRVHIIYSISGIYTNTKKPNDRRLQRLNVFLLQSYSEDTRSMYTEATAFKKEIQLQQYISTSQTLFLSKLIFFYISFFSINITFVHPVVSDIVPFHHWWKWWKCSHLLESHAALWARVGGSLFLVLFCHLARQVNLKRRKQRPHQ